jgi:hypothetical protein
VPGKQPQVPPLRYAPVGMTILLHGLEYFSLNLLRARQNCHPDRSVAKWRDLRLLFSGSQLFRNY